MEYETLLKKADRLGLIVKEADLKTKDGFCKGNRIAINERLITDAEKRCVLAEEIGHYKTTTGDITDQTKTINRKQELVARRWGHQQIVTLVSLIEAFEYGAQSSYEIAEFLEVPEKYLNECIEDYRRKYGFYFMLEQYCIYFEPNLKIGKIFNPVIK